MLTHTVVRFGSCKSITREDVGELGEELLNWRQSGKKRSKVEGRLSYRRGVQDNGLQVISGNYLMSIDVEEEVAKNQPQGEKMILEQL